VVQPKLEVGRPDDPAEREAERVARRVVSGSDSARSSCPSNECGGRPTEGIRRATTGNDATSLDDERARQVRSAIDGGQRLPSAEREFFESRFDHDFSDVRVHTGPRADDVARSIHAEAFTLGSDIAFADGNYRPGTRRGRELLAHELTHVVQQADQGGETASLQRLVSANQVSCADYPADHPTYDVTGTSDPVGRIQEAEKKALFLLDNATQRLNRYAEAIENDPAAVDDVPTFISEAVHEELDIEPTDPSNWTEAGAGTVSLAVHRLERVRELMDASNYEYTCVGEVGVCEGAVDANAYADWDHASGSPEPEIYLCRSWWEDGSIRDNARTLIHELLHFAYWGLLGHDLDVDADSYDALVDRVAIEIIRLN